MNTLKVIEYRYTRRRSWNCDRVLSAAEYAAEMDLNRQQGHKIKETARGAVVTIKD